jgi:peptidyl-prolyl cis-trans isomerase A (cyclophilin A)
MSSSLKTGILAILFACLASTSRADTPECFPEDVMPENMFPAVLLETSMGDIVVELNRLRAPVSTNNFLRYVLEKKYNNTIFHRVMPGFVVQGGGYTEALEERDLHPPIINESGNGLKNMPMTLAMARFDNPHSASNQFYFNLAGNSSLDPNSKNWGYAVFGMVISGSEVVEAISGVETGYSENLDAADVPLVPVKLLSATILEEPH